MEELKRRGFTDPTMRDWTFENDNGRNPQAGIARRYVEHWEDMRTDNIGCLFWGGVGTGKSYLAGCIANALMEKEIPVHMTNFALILNDLAASFEKVLTRRTGGEQMDDRKLKILSAVVNEYIVTGEPVGSKAIMAHVKASSATIRNEMAELEKQGYLEQPHTSAGRIPTYKGYRLYVDQLMEQNQLTANEKKMLDSMIPQEYVTEEDLVNKASMALADLTKCAAVVANATPKFSLISKVEVIPTGKRMYVILTYVTTSSTNQNRESTVCSPPWRQSVTSFSLSHPL